jgi:hypothetical protein
MGAKRKEEPSRRTKVSPADDSCRSNVRENCDAARQRASFVDDGEDDHSTTHGASAS